jgi:putative ABC transport system permease protein
MLRNYFKTALRSLMKNKGFSIINILGLTIGIASFVLISLYVYHELNFDRYHKNANRIYRIVENLRTENELLFQAASSPPMGPMMASQFPEVENYVRLTQYSALVRKGDLSIFEEDGYLADSSIFNIFSFPLLKGDKKTALTAPNSVVLTESTAKKYFGDENAVGKTLNLDNEEFAVTGIMADVPENSHFRFDMLISFSTWSSKNKENEMRAWFWNGFYTYLLIREGAVEKVKAKMPAFITKNIEKGGMYYEELPLQPLTSIYLATPRSWENGKRGSLNNIYILSIIAIFILLIACFNYVNLATARASRRLKEVGLRKVLGAQRRALIYQFLGESILVSVVATLLGFQLAAFLFTSFSSLVETQINFSILPKEGYSWAAFAIISLVLGVLSGAYPALIISGFDPLQMFRGSHSFFGNNSLRKVLVSAQFVISITLIAGTLLVFDQLALLRNRDMGFRREATLLINYNGNGNVRDHLDVVKDEFLKLPEVQSVTASATVPGESTNNLYANIEMQDGKLSPTNINTNFVDRDFLPSYDIDVIAGRNFSKDFPADDTTAFIVNETAVKGFGMKPDDAIGKTVEQNGKKGTIIGVVKDFHYRSLHQAIEPLILQNNIYAYSTLSIKLRTSDMPATVMAIGKKWKELSDNLPYRYAFLDDNFNKLYKADAQLGKVAGIFSGLAIFVGCLGLLGLTSFSVERRVKEIGIRKVLGATVSNVIVIISKEFVLLIMISFVIAVPLTYYLIGKWLENFTDQISVSPVTFFVAGFSVFALALTTMGYLSFRAAISNPTKALRNE